MGTARRFNVPPRPGAQTTPTRVESAPPQDPNLRPSAPSLRKNSPSAPDAPDDSTQTHAAQGTELCRVATQPVIDLLDPTPVADESESSVLARLCSVLQQCWATLVALLMAGSLRFVISRSDEKPYLMYSGGSNALLIPIDRQSPAIYSLLRQCAGTQREGTTRRQMDECVEDLAAHAQVYGERMDTFYRLAPLPDGGIAIDIGDTARTQVWIKPGYVEIVTRGSILPFRRSKSMQPLAIPANCGVIDRLKKYIKAHPTSVVLLIAWITYTIAHPKQESNKYVILVLQGGEGSGKTSLCKIFQRLIDPSAVSVRSFPRNIQDLAVAIHSSHLAIFDNIRSVPPPMSDALCMSSTGGSLSGRKLYTDDVQASQSLHGAVILNGIHAHIEQPDLAQRTLPVRLVPMPHEDRLPDDVLAAQFEDDLPYIMRGLYDLIAEILKHLPTVEVTHPTRMMGFSRWLAAMERAYDEPIGVYQDLYQHAIREAQLDAVMDNPVGEAVLDLLARDPKGIWVGTPTELLNDLEKIADRRVLRTRDWPSNPIALSKRLQTLQVALNAQGVSVQTSRGKSRLITLKATGEK